MYTAENSLQYQEFWFEMEKAKSHYRANQTLNFYVDPSTGNDDYLMSLALLVQAVNLYSPREARGREGIASAIQESRPILISPFTP